MTSQFGMSINVNKSHTERVVFLEERVYVAIYQGSHTFHETHFRWNSISKFHYISSVRECLQLRETRGGNNQLRRIAVRSKKKHMR